MERKKLYNAYEQHEGYNCFGCASGNEHGLRCEFYEEGEYITCHWMPRPEFQGFFHVLHGGIQATLMDEIACWNVFAKVKSAGVTVELTTKYRATVYSDREKYSCVPVSWNKVPVWQRCTWNYSMRMERWGSEADVVYRIFPENVARQRLGWTGIEAFHPEENE
ncbi:MAG: PaaI family thioesterase [Butyricimonas faecihominis]